ncbi:hypothetical protein [Marinicella litoralis]|uniref:PilZ domain-containing protein n=1 Tax=Marinicella litoralis TaxID=644220 RepID=A0A4R6Y3A8_9GAMM|nr:hypothetical protein [Marinicella litoralis]TDR23528.1 hypothetical protein C8D91_0391 [Marinicella litoralis]
MNQETIERQVFNNLKHWDRPVRLRPDNKVNVVDSCSNELIGHVLNFNEFGMQLLMLQNRALNEIHELTLLLNLDHCDAQHIKVFAELLWVKEEGGHFLGGFYLCSKNFKSKFRMNQWLKSLL